jgi:hydrogenase/urease accessory protein HupE
MMQVDEHALPAVRDFIIGSIILFSLAVSMLRNKAHLFAIPPIAFWLYICGGGYMDNIPTITTPLYFLLGALTSVIMMIAIGVSLGITLTEAIQRSMDKAKTLPAISSFLSLF